MCIEDLLGRIADVLAEGNEINQKRLELCKEILALQKEKGGRVEEPDHSLEESSAPKESERTLDRAALLKRCEDLHISVPKGTKTATLPKLIADAETRENEGESRGEEERPQPPESENVVAVQGPRAFESREDLRAACRLLPSDPEKVTDAERAAAAEVYSRYGRCIDEIPQGRWGEFYNELKKAFDEVHSNA